jgi:hypothetical protein
VTLFIEEIPWLSAEDKDHGVRRLRVDRMEDLGLPTCLPRTTWCTPNTIMHFGSKVSARVPYVPIAAEFSQVQE